MRSGNEQDSTINITVVPKSSRLAIKIEQNRNIKVYLTSAPEDGKANLELVKFFSKTLKIPKSSIKIIKGERSRNKKLFICNFSEKELFDKFNDK